MPDDEYLRLLLKSVPSKIIGDKKALLAEIASVIPPEAETVFDAFAGSGVVSLYLKSRGYRLVSNEIRLAPYEWLIALVQNNHTVLSQAEVDLLLSKPESERRDFRRHFPEILGERNAAFFDRVASNLGRLDSDLKRSIAISGLNVVVESHLTHWNCHPTVDRTALCGTGDFACCDIERDWREYLLQKFPRLLSDNGRRNLAYNEDAASIANRVSADVAYFDPPYPSTNNNYEWSYRMYDLFVWLCRGGRLGGDPWKEDHLKPHQHFGGLTEGLGNLWELMIRSSDIPQWILSINESSSVKTDHLTSFIEATGRSVERRKFKVRRSTTAAGRDVWTWEYLLICRPDETRRLSRRETSNQNGRTR